MNILNKIIETMEKERHYTLEEIRERWKACTVNLDEERTKE